MSYCTKCEESLPSDGNFVECKHCNGSYHFKCSTLAQRTWTAMGAPRREVWQCEFCRLSDKVVAALSKKVDLSFVKPIMQPMLDPVNESIREVLEKINDCVKSQSFLSEQYDDLLKKQSEMCRNMGEIEKNLIELVNSNKEKDDIIDGLIRRVNILEQHNRKGDIIVYGVQERTDEDLSAVIVDVGKHFNVNISDDDIISANRIPTKNKNLPKRSGVDGSGSTKPRPIAVSFLNVNKKDALLRNRKGALAIESDIFGGGSNNAIKIYEMLSPYYSKLLYLCRQKVFACKWKYVWFSDNCVKCRKEDNSGVVSIFSEKDLYKIA